MLFRIIRLIERWKRAITRLIRINVTYIEKKSIFGIYLSQSEGSLTIYKLLIDN